MSPKDTNLVNAVTVPSDYSELREEIQRHDVPEYAFLDDEPVDVAAQARVRIGAGGDYQPLSRSRMGETEYSFLPETPTQSKKYCSLQ